MSTNASSLAVDTRDPQHSRDARRARRAGRIPGVVYGGGQPPLSISADARELGRSLAAAGAVIDIKIDDGQLEPVVLKEAQRHPVRGQVMHVDFMRVDLKQKIQQPVLLEFVGIEESPGVRQGGVVEQHLREVIVEALPNAIPETIIVSLTELEVGDTMTLADAQVPEGVEIVDDLETVVLGISIPRGAASDEDEDEDGETAAE